MSAGDSCAAPVVSRNVAEKEQRVAGLSTAAGLTIAALCVTAGPARAQTESQTFHYTGATQTFKVPADVCSIDIEADGASGGRGWSGPVGGLGANVLAKQVAVVPGAHLSITVGGAGGDATRGDFDSDDTGTGGPGGFNGGGVGGNGPWGGGGGGGETRIADATHDLVTAAGGGGSGGFRYGGTGGAGGLDGTAGGDASHSAAMGGASGGDGGAGGAGALGQGATGGHGAAGAGGAGADSTLDSGGGGGAGLIGGGGGGSLSAGGEGVGGGGGGGGGSSFGPSGATFVTGAHEGDGDATISWEPDTCAPSESPSASHSATPSAAPSTVPASTPPASTRPATPAPSAKPQELAHTGSAVSTPAGLAAMFLGMGLAITVPTVLRRRRSRS